VLNLPISRWHLDRESVTSELVKNSALKKGDLNPKSIQFGATEVTVAFAAAGHENFNVSITFPTAFAAEPSVIIASASLAGILTAIVGKTAKGFTCNVSDAGVDYTTCQTFTIYWMAVE